MMEVLKSNFGLEADITDEKCEAVLKSFDLNHNSRIEFDEFCKMIRIGIPTF